MKRVILPLDGKWRFILDLGNVGENEGWFKTDFSDESWLLVDVPNNWDYYRPELFGYTGIGWFRRWFNLCKEWSGKRLVLKFEGVNYSAKVWINGVPIGSHEGGFISFEFDISDKVRFDETNLIAIKVENIPNEKKVPSSLAGWWNYGGIYRDVYIEVKDNVYVDDVFINAIPVQDHSQLNLKYKIMNKSSETVHVKITSSITTPKGEVILDWDQDSRLAMDIEIPADSSETFEREIQVKGLKKWSIEEPNLYMLNVSLRSPEGELIDSISTNFGVRSVTVKNGKLHLNGKPVRIKGVNRHEEYPNSGRYDRDNLTESDLRMIKNDLGANMVRIHYLCDSRFYDLADKIGLMVFAEIPFWGMRKETMMDREIIENAKQQLRELVKKLKNHPSVVIWSVGNECESDNEVARSVISELIQFVKEMDSTRPVTYVSYYIYSDDRWCKCLDLGDFVSINAYFDVYTDRLEKALERIRRDNPDKAILITEFGAEAVRGVHGKIPGGEEHQADVIKRTWNLILSKDYLMGGIVWSFTDYWHQPRRLGTAYLNPVYFLHGILDLERRPKKSFNVLSALYKEEDKD